jgi:2-polyprenyl-3-methyl-5-hydroxy-6-metoxy-1,4-benzoquinol methylase
LELGCGTGAVIAECMRRGLASEYTAVDYSIEAVEYLRLREPGIRCLTADIADPAFKLDGRFDTIILSHVLEHLEDPLSFLKVIKARFRFSSLIVEVPLEDLPVMRVKALFYDRNINTAGHVQFFTAESFKALIRHAGFQIEAERRFVPRMSAEAIRFASGVDGLTQLRTIYKVCAACYIPRMLGPLWKWLWYSHLAVSCHPENC